jgi:superfamily II DNA or RNA helicase
MDRPCPTPNCLSLESPIVYSRRVKGIQHRLEFLARQLSAPEWRLLGAIAIERELGLTPILRLATSFGVAPKAIGNKPVLAQRPLVAGGSRLRSHPIPGVSAPGSAAPSVSLDALAQCLQNGLLIEVGLAKASSLSRPGVTEPAYAVAPEFRQLVLRHLAASGDLAVVAEATHGLFGERSLGAFALLLQTGRLAEFQRYTFSLPRASGRLGEDIQAEDLLRDAITRPFDAAWFRATWKGAAVPAAQRVLREALPELHECDGLFDWLRRELESGSPQPADTDPSIAVSDAALRQTLAEHAILRGRPEMAESYAEALPRANALAVQAAAHYQNGELSAAQALIEERQLLRGVLPDTGAITPLLALIAYGRGSAAATQEAKRLLSPRNAEASSGVDRAFRTLLRYGSEPASEHARLDVHQLGRDKGGWELLILALTVHLHLEQDVTRASWAVQLVRSGALWLGAGYSWMGRQALFLARALNREYFDREFEKVKAELFLDSLEARPGELALSDLITPKPQWERALDALAELAETPNTETYAGRRVAWFVNMQDGSLERPALQELKEGGWSRGRRLTLAQLYAHSHELPAEDVSVLSCTQQLGEDKREYTPEALEALIGHPRVWNGARGGLRVEVAAGSCRIETEDEDGFLSIRVEPAGAQLGVNAVVENEARLVVYRVTPAMQRVIEVLQGGLRVPKEQERQALSVLGKLSQGVEVQSKHLGADREVEADATPCLRFSPQAGAWLVQAGVRPFGASGRFFLAGAGKSAISLYTGGERLLCSRDLKLERARVSQLISTVPILLECSLDREGRAPGDAVQSWDFDQAGVLDLLLELRDAPERCELEWPESEALRVRGRVTAKSLSGTLRRKKGWYLATGGVQLDAQTEVALSELAQGTVVAGGRFVRLPNGDFLAIEERVRRVMAALENTVPLPHRPRELKIHEGSLHVLSALRELAGDGEDGALGGGLSIDAATRDWLDRVESVKTQVFAVPSTLEATLRGYQLDGFRWLSYLSALGLGACLADDMGLGKTVQILALLLTRLEEGPTLVVAPTSVCTNWVIEAARFAPTLRVREYAGTERGELLSDLADIARAPQLVVCSYGLLQQDVEALAAVTWGTVVLDEAQFIKNAESQRAQAACRLQAKCRIAATGTPVENHLGDLWSIFNFLNPGLLGPFRAFSRRFLKPIEREGNNEVRLTLQEHIKPFILRRKKSEVLAHLPPLTVVQHNVQLSEVERAGYARLQRQIHDKLYTTHGRRENKLEILAEITRLRRYCCHPRLVFPEADLEASKLQVFLDLVLELRENQHRALVFSQYVDFLDLVRQRLDEALVSYQYLDGSTPKAQRQARVDAFQGGEGTLFLISLKAGGFGLNLTAADYVIHLDPWWNPAVEAQATDRAHRIGQERPVTVYRLITKDTIEESIVLLHQNKQALADALLQGGNQAAQLSVGELVGLIEKDAPGTGT